MPTIHIALQKSFQTIMAIANDCIGLILAAIMPHDCNLFFLRMRDELSLRLFYIVFWSKSGIFSGLFPIQGAPAKICFFVIFI